MANTYFITGAEGAGKSTIVPSLKKNLREIDIRDFDEVGVPLNPSLKWRIDTTKHWIKIVLANQKKEKSTCIIGLSFPNEIRKIKESEKIKNIYYILLDVSVKERKNRLKKRKSQSHVIKDPEQLKSLKKIFKSKLKNKHRINTTNLSTENVSNLLIKFIGLKEK